MSIKTLSRTKPAKSSINQLPLLLLLLLLSSRIVDAKTACHICGGVGNSALKFPHIILEGVGRTCTQISLDVALNAPIDSQDCQEQQKKWDKACCSGKRPDGQDPPQGLPPQEVPAVRYLGPHPVCDLCKDGDYPYTTSMVINFLYIGSSSCAQYYVYGKQGRIEPHMCDPVQYFAYEPCGCGEFNPYFNPKLDQAPEPNDDEDEVVFENKSRQVPDLDGKEDKKMANGRGGNGNGGTRRRNARRGLKGSRRLDHSASVAL